MKIDDEKGERGEGRKMVAGERDKSKGGKEKKSLSPGDGRNCSLAEATQGRGTLNYRRSIA